MKTPSVLCLVSVVLAGFIFMPSSKAQLGGAKGSADAKKEILGTWEGFMANEDGSPQGRIKLEITADEITASNPGGGQVMGTGTYKLSGATNKTKRIDAKGTSGQYQGKKYEGIFSIEGKTLKWCSGNDRATSRPDDLKTNVRSNHFLMVLEKK